MPLLLLFFWLRTSSSRVIQYQKMKKLFPNFGRAGSKEEQSRAETELVPLANSGIRRGANTITALTYSFFIFSKTHYFLDCWGGCHSLSLFKIENKVIHKSMIELPKFLISPYAFELQQNQKPI